MASDMFAGRLRELRAAAGMSQTELADRAGMTKDGIAHLEQGRRAPSWETILALCAALDVECTAFTQAPKTMSKRGRGRPRKTAGASMGKPTAAPKRKTRKGR